MMNSHRSVPGAERHVETVINHAIGLELVNDDGGCTALEADLRYDTRDQFAVDLVFKAGIREVVWTFGRELLMEGVYEPAGDGDVHVWPCLSASGTAVVIVELDSPSGQVMVQVPTRQVHAFVAATLTAVPAGAEEIDLDAALAALLA